jgi:transposase
VVVAAVPWARHGSGFTRAFEEQAAWLATHCSKSAVAGLMRVVWRSVGRIITRVVHEQRKSQDLLDGLRRIGIDEISYRKGQRYLMVVVNHDTGRLVWAANGLCHRPSLLHRAWPGALRQDRKGQLRRG